MNWFKIDDTPLVGLKLVQRERRTDSRGFLSRIFCADELAAAGWTAPIAQINHTFTGRAGTVRGLHYQRPPHAEIKLVTCLSGAVWDVVVDLRAGSPTFLRWHAVSLSVENGAALLIPAGFAHGFQSLADDVALLYCHSTGHAAQAEAGLNPMDKRLGVNWPLPVIGLSERDMGHAAITDQFNGVAI